MKPIVQLETLKKQIADQYGHELNPKLMEVGYFKQSKNLWLNNKLHGYE